MADFDKQKAADWLIKNAMPKYGVGKCATHVRLGLEAGGLNTTGHPDCAKDWGPTLIRKGFAVTDTRVAKLGDIVVFQMLDAKNAAGHIEYYDGKNWISDFIQDGFWPGHRWEKANIAHKTYRLP